MNIPDPIVKATAQSHLNEVAAKTYTPSLLLVGSHSSPFLRSGNRLAQEVGMDTHILSYLPPLIGEGKVVVDRETGDTVTNLPADADVDNLYNPGISCVA